MHSLHATGKGKLGGTIGSQLFPTIFRESCGHHKVVSQALILLPHARPKQVWVVKGQTRSVGQVWAFVYQNAWASANAK